ncbi:MAG: hypothetical protein ACRBG0_04070 [Lewinella sp.]|uniref:hypothetical protein n=1 Tax=Lewinella sp. TaxID=2004506 RepID=UPI003D6ABD58
MCPDRMIALVRLAQKPARKAEPEARRTEEQDNGMGRSDSDRQPGAEERWHGP